MPGSRGSPIAAAVAVVVVAKLAALHVGHVAQEHEHERLGGAVLAVLPAPSSCWSPMGHTTRR
jgi:hypothetical protein